MRSTYTVQTQVHPDALMETILDFGNYPSFAPYLHSCTVVVQKENMWEVNFVVQVIHTLSYRLRLIRTGYEVTWDLVEGIFTENSGYWKVEPIIGEDGGVQGSNLTYSLQVEMNTFIPSSVRNTLYREMLPKTVHAFIDETVHRQLLANTAVHLEA
jgi:ribosome-associated toxin RatA of RatAB toxin-antitoxin module